MLVVENYFSSQKKYFLLVIIEPNEICMLIF